MSHSSLESGGAGADEFVLVNAHEPRLRIANNGDADGLRSELSEVLSDEAKRDTAKMADTMPTASSVNEPELEGVAAKEDAKGESEEKKLDVPAGVSSTATGVLNT